MKVLQMQTELPRCVCGEQTRVIKHEITLENETYMGSYQCECIDCGCAGPMCATEQEAIEMYPCRNWSTQHALPKQKELIKSQEQRNNTMTLEEYRNSNKHLFDKLSSTELETLLDEAIDRLDEWEETYFHSLAKLKAETPGTRSGDIPCRLLRSEMENDIEIAWVRLLHPQNPKEDIK